MPVSETYTILLPSPLAYTKALALTWTPATVVVECVCGVCEVVDNVVYGFAILLTNVLGLNVTSTALIPALKAGKIDAIAAAMSATPERKKSVDFSDPYFFTKNLYLKLATNNSITNKEQLSKLKIGVMLGTVQEGVAHAIKGAKVIPTEGIAGSIMNLKAGKVATLPA